METEPGNSFAYPRNEKRPRDARRKVVTGAEKPEVDI